MNACFGKPTHHDRGVNERMNLDHVMKERTCYFISTGLGNHPAHAYYRGLGQELATRGHPVLFLMGLRDKKAEDHESNPAIYIWPSRRPTRPVDFLFLWQLVRRHRPCCLISYSGAVNVMMVVGRLKRVPCRVAWVHSLSSQSDMDGCATPLWKATYLKPRKRIVYMTATHIVANSNASREDTCREFGVPAHKCHILPYLTQDPLDGKEASSPSRKRGNTIVSVGRLVPSKGQDTLIKAVCLLKEKLPLLKAEFIGNGPLYSHYVTLADSLGVGEICSFVGSLPHAGVQTRLRSADVTIVSSRAEAFGHVIVDSMSVGTPVIASNVGAIPEIVKDGVVGFLVPPDDPEALAERIKLLLTDTKLREQMGRNGRERFLSRFEWTRNIPRQMDWFEQIVEDALGRKCRRSDSFAGKPKASQPGSEA